MARHRDRAKTQGTNVKRNSRSLIVSIHDVSPLTQAVTDSMLRELRGLGVTRCSLLVIPNHHHRGHFSHDAAFCNWLRERVQEGHEAVIHGYFHQRAPGTGESLRDRLTTQFYTANEGEFYDLDEESARLLVMKARDEFRAAGFDPVGFIAPAWLLSEGAERGLRALGILYTTRLGSVIELQSGRFAKSQSLVYSVRAGWRRACSLLWNRLLFRRLRHNPLLRVGIHPPDYQFPAVWRQIRALIAQGLHDREPITYADWVLSSPP